MDVVRTKPGSPPALQFILLRQHLIVFGVSFNVRGRDIRDWSQTIKMIISSQLWQLKLEKKLVQLLLKIYVDFIMEHYKEGSYLFYYKMDAFISYNIVGSMLPLPSAL